MAIEVPIEGLAGPTAPQGPIVKVQAGLWVTTEPNGAGSVTAMYRDPDDITLLQLAQLIQADLMGALGLSVKTTQGATYSFVPFLAGTAQISFGSGTTPATPTDSAIQTALGGTNPVGATVQAVSGTLWNVAATWNNTTGGSVWVSEMAMYVTAGTISGTNVYALTRDVFGTQLVSPGGSATGTLTFAFT